jgi:hypothetical protein
MHPHPNPGRVDIDDRAVGFNLPWPVVENSIRVLEHQGAHMHLWIYGPWVPGSLGNPSKMRWLTLGKPASIKDSHKGGEPRIP